MPKNAAKSEVNNFVGGLITEASELAFPPNASPDILNFEHNRDGSIQRRLGIGFESLYELITPPLEVNSANDVRPLIYKWTNVSGIPNLSLLVIQIDNTLMFFDNDLQQLSSEGYLGSLVLTGFPKDKSYGISSVDGKLAIAAGVEKIAVVTYDGTTFSVFYDVLKTRDLWGIANKTVTGVKYDADPLYQGFSLPEEQAYNLQNQSWALPRSEQTNGASQPPIQQYYNVLGKYPSNSEQVWTGLQYKPDSGGNPTERYYPSMSNDLYGTSGLAPKGFFIIDVVNRGKSRYDAATSLKTRLGSGGYSYSVPNKADYTDGGATVLTEFAGRIFYGGFSGKNVGGDVRSPNLSNYVFFTQLVRSTSDIFKCYQQGDPTSRDDSDIVDTDGGFIRLAGAEGILGMVPLGSSLIVVATNGVWSITGGSDYGFSATNYRVDKVSTFGCISSTSIVEEKGKVFYWGDEGIYVIARNQLGDLSAESITLGRIDSFYQNLPIAARSSAIGVNDKFSGKIRWIYDNLTSTYELILDTGLGCFYPFEIKYPNVTTKIVGVFTTSPFNKFFEVDTVAVGADDVFSNTDQVQVDIGSSRNTLTSVKYLVRVESQYTFAYYNDKAFQDWPEIQGIDAKARGVTGAVTANDSSIRKQVQFLTMHFKRPEPEISETSIPESRAGCLSQAKWDWANSAESSKWSALKQIYRNPKPKDLINFDIISTRNMLRGHGRALSIYFETEPGKDCHIVGWNLAIDGNSKV